MKPVLGSLLSWPMDQLVSWTWQAKRSQTSHHPCLSSLKIISLFGVKVQHKTMLIRTAAIFHHIPSSQVVHDRHLFFSLLVFFFWLWPVLIQYFVRSYTDLHFCSPADHALSLMKVLSHSLFLQTVNRSLCSASLNEAPPPLSLFMLLSLESCCITSWLLAVSVSAQPLATSSFVRSFLKVERWIRKSGSYKYRKKGIRSYQEGVYKCQSYLKMRVTGVEQLRILCHERRWIWMEGKCGRIERGNHNKDIY